MILKEHQKRVLNKLSQNTKGLLAYHLMGSGKTLLSLMALKKFSGKKIIISPASIQNIYYDEAKKFDISIENTVICSFEKYLKNETLFYEEYSIVIIDEAHRLRNPATKLYHSIEKLLNRSNKVLLLSGTPEYNQPVDICNIVYLINNDASLPRTMDEFENEFINKSNYTLKNYDILCKKLSKYVDIYFPNSSDDYPSQSDEIIKIPMGNLQFKIYKYFEKKLPYWVRKSIYRDVPLSISESSKLNFFSSAIRQISDSINKYIDNPNFTDNPKIISATSHLIKYISEEYFRCIIYSNYITSCIIPYSNYLYHNNINHYLFTGKTTSANKKAIIKEYNSDDKSPKIILLSSTGTEGLDLRGTTLIQILEPHFNYAKINQVIHRGIRYLSHSHLPISKRHVFIERYLSVFPERWYNRFLNIKLKVSIDEYLYDISKKKEKIMDEITQRILYYNSK